MRTLSLSLLILLSGPLNAHAIFGDTPKETIEMKIGKKCYRYDDKVIFVQVHETDGPPSVSVGQSKITMKSSFQSDCDNAKQNIVIKEVENAELLGIIGSLAFFETSMSGAGTGALRVYSLDDGSQKVSAATDGSVIELKKNEVFFYQPKKSLNLNPDDKESLKAWKETGCKDIWAKGGMGCAQYVKTILDLKTLKLTETNEMKVEAEQ